MTQINNIRHQHQTISRSDIADTTRSKQDLLKQISNLRNELTESMTNHKITDYNEINEMYEKKNDLVKLEDQVKELYEKIDSMQPSINSNAKLTDNEVREIQGFAATGRYTQQQLAEQYGVKQPTISDVIRRKS